MSDRECTCMCDGFHVCHFYSAGGGLHYKTIITAKINNSFKSNCFQKDSINPVFSWLRVGHSLMHVKSLGATLRVITEYLANAVPLLWPRPSFIGHHCYWGDWNVSHTMLLFLLTGQTITSVLQHYCIKMSNPTRTSLAKSVKAAQCMDLEAFRAGVRCSWGSKRNMAGHH